VWHLCNRKGEVAQLARRKVLGLLVTQKSRARFSLMTSQLLRRFQKRHLCNRHWCSIASVSIRSHNRHWSWYGGWCYILYWYGGWILLWIKFNFEWFFFGWRNRYFRNKHVRLASSTHLSIGLLLVNLSPWYNSLCLLSWFSFASSSL
jgi:hypothetical protein